MRTSLGRRSIRSIPTDAYTQTRASASKQFRTESSSTSTSPSSRVFFREADWSLGGEPILVDSGDDLSELDNSDGYSCAYNTSDRRTVGFGWSNSTLFPAVPPIGPRITTNAGDNQMSLQYDWVRNDTAEINDYGGNFLVTVGEIEASGSVVQQRWRNR